MCVMRVVCYSEGVACDQKTFELVYRTIRVRQDLNTQLVGTFTSHIWLTSSQCHVVTMASGCLMATCH